MAHQPNTNLIAYLAGGGSQGPEIEEIGGGDGEPAEESHGRGRLELGAVILRAVAQVIADEHRNARRRTRRRERHRRRNLHEITNEKKNDSTTGIVIKLLKEA